jgi:hypothetical protein
MHERLRLMAVPAHPDAERLVVGGTLALYAARGVETYLVTATRGERGRYVTNENRPRDEEVGRVREAERRAAARVLGVREERVSRRACSASRHAYADPLAPGPRLLTPQTFGNISGTMRRRGLFARTPTWHARRRPTSDRPTVGVGTGDRRCQPPRRRGCALARTRACRSRRIAPRPWPMPR